MSDITVARRYAQALTEQASADGTVNTIDKDMDLIRESLDGSRELVTFFGSPVISREKKTAVVDELFAPRVHETTLKFLKLLIDKQREGIIPAVARAYRELRDEQQGIIEATARVAQPLQKAEEKDLQQRLETLTGKQIRLQTKVDPSLIGGLVVRVGDTVYDGSVRHQLENLRERLEHGSFALN